MIDSYDQAAAILKDSGCGELPPVDQMIPEIAEVLARLDEKSSAYRRQDGSPSSERRWGRILNPKRFQFSARERT